MRAIKLKEAGTSQIIEMADCEIHIEANPDTWRGGYVWSVCLGDVELDSGLEFSFCLAQSSAEKCISGLQSPIVNSN